MQTHGNTFSTKPHKDWIWYSKIQESCTGSLLDKRNTCDVNLTDEKLKEKQE